MALLFVAAIALSTSLKAQNSVIAVSTGTFVDNTVLALAGSPQQEVYGVTFGRSTAVTTANGYSFSPCQNNNNPNVDYASSGNFTGYLSGGGTSGDPAFDNVCGSGVWNATTGVLTLKNLTVGVNYRVLFVISDTRAAQNGRTFGIAAGGVTGVFQRYAYSGGTPALGGYIVASFTASATTQIFQVTSPQNDLQLSGVLLCYANADTAFSNGTFSNNTVLTKAGTPAQQVYGVNLASSATMTTSNGYRFDADINNNNPNINYVASGWFNGYLSGGGSSGDSAFDSVVGTGAWGGSANGYLTLKNLTAGQFYNVLLLQSDTRAAQNGRSFNVTVGTATSAYQPYAYAGGNTALGGYVLATFKANGPTQTLFLNTPGNNYQLNAVLVTNVTAPYTPTIMTETPTLNPNETVVAVTTPQQYGAVADGVTDCTAAFQAAINAAWNSGHRAGGVVYVPAGTYAFNGSLTLRNGVTLHGDWTDWTAGTTGAVGTIFKINTTGAATGTPFITMQSSSGIKGINFWYPNQSPSSIQPYPFTISIANACMVQNTTLINSYQGIKGINTNAYTLSTLIGSPLYMGFYGDVGYDICHGEDIRFNPDVWVASKLPGAPTSNTAAHASFMRSNGTGICIGQIDGYVHTATQISGYKVGLAMVASAADNSKAGTATFYGGSITNCSTAVLADKVSGSCGLQFSNFTLQGDIAVDRTTSDDVCLKFHTCAITGTLGTAIRFTSADWHGFLICQDCTITGTINHVSGAINLVNCALTGTPQCIMGPAAVRAGFTGCSFNGTSTPSITNNTGNPANLNVSSYVPQQIALPTTPDWSSVTTRYQQCAPAKPTQNLAPNLYVATSAPYGAVGDGVHDDTANIQSALNAAGNAGGGIVYLPGGHYKTSGTLSVPSRVELRGIYELRHQAGPWTGDSFCKASVIQPTAGQGTSSGPAAILLNANSGLVGVDITYENQIATATPYAFPPAIQGNGANIYVIGVVCPNAWYYLDLASYKCSDHFIYMVDGYALNTGFNIGKGSNGIVANIQINPSYWTNAQDTTSVYNSAVWTYSNANLAMFKLGDCDEYMWKTFVIINKYMVQTVAENGRGPTLHGISTNCDATYCAYFMDSAAASTIYGVNGTLAMPNVTGLTLPTSGNAVVYTTSAFQGTLQLFNSAIFGRPSFDFVIGNGTVAIELMQMFDHGFYDSTISGGTFHLVANCAYITYDPATGSFTRNPNKYVFTGAGISGQTSEIAGCYSQYGYAYTNANPNNPVTVRNNYNANNYNVLNQ